MIVISVKSAKRIFAKEEIKINIKIYNELLITKITI